MPQRPNVLLMMCDSMDGRAIGCMGHPAMAQATPNMDRLADKGVLFSNNYCNSPLCVPSRASMWSGEYVHHCEAWNNFKGLARDTPTFETKLADAGYTVTTIGKTDYLSGRHTLRARVAAWTRSANIMKPNFRMRGPEILPDHHEMVHKKDWETIEKCIEYLGTASSFENPFLIHCGIGTPHPPFVTSKKHLDMIEDEGVEIPPVDETSHPALVYQRITKNWMHGFSDEMIRKVRKTYFAMIAEVDMMVGKVVTRLEDLGLDKSTVLVFTSDHGELAMEHNQFYKQSLYEPSVRAPLIITGPRIEKALKVEDPTSLVDIYPTLIDLCQLPHPPRVDGQSLTSFLKREGNNRRNLVFSEFHADTLNTGAFMVRTGVWKYIAYAGMKPQLFNLEEDPWEINNLSSKCKEKAKQMDDLLRSIVDYEKVDAKAKHYDKTSFRKWRQKQKEAGTYEETMTRIFSGWDNLGDKETTPWTVSDEQLIGAWLRKDAAKSAIN